VCDIFGISDSIYDNLIKTIRRQTVIAGKRQIVQSTF